MDTATGWMNFSLMQGNINRQDQQDRQTQTPQNKKVVSRLAPAARRCTSPGQRKRKGVNVCWHGCSGNDGMKKVLNAPQALRFTFLGQQIAKRVNVFWHSKSLGEEQMKILEAPAAQR